MIMKVSSLEKRDCLCMFYRFLHCSYKSFSLFMVAAVPRSFKYAGAVVVVVKLRGC